MNTPATLPASPPKARGLPYFGSLRDLLRDPVGFFTRTARRYGGLVRIPLPQADPLYLVSDPALLRELLIDQRARFVKNTRYRAMRQLLGEGLLLSEGDTWKRQRLHTQPAFKPSELSRQIDWMSRVIARELNRWEAYAQQQTVFDLEIEAFRLMQKLAGVLILGPGFEARAEAVFQATEGIRTNWPKPRRGIIASRLPRSRRSQRRMEDAIAGVEREVYAAIAAQRAPGAGDGGILQLLIRGSAKEGKPYTDLELRDQIMTLFFAGYETGAASLCWTQYFLSQNASARIKLSQEVDAQLGSRLPQAADMGRLHYVEQVFKETLRMYSPIHSLSRVAVENTCIGGYDVPKGATTVVCLHATHRLPEHWPEPDTFNPDRFDAKSGAGRHSAAYIPFAIGHRNCIGHLFAMEEGKLVLAQITQRFEVEILPGQRIEPFPTTTMRPRYGMQVRLHLRTQTES